MLARGEGWKREGCGSERTRKAVMLQDEHMHTGSSLVQRAKNLTKPEEEKERKKEIFNRTAVLNSKIQEKENY